MARANNSPTAKEFFDHLKKAVSLADKASDGEKLLILANEAGANGDTVKQKDYLDKLVTAYPNDHRTKLNLTNYHFAQQELEPAAKPNTEATHLPPHNSPTHHILPYA